MLDAVDLVPVVPVVAHAPQRGWARRFMRAALAVGNVIRRAGFLLRERFLNSKRGWNFENILERSWFSCSKDLEFLIIIFLVFYNEG